MDFDSWNDQLRDELLEAADAPEDWSGAVDVESEDLDREFEDNARTAWSTPDDRSLAPLDRGRAELRASRHLRAASARSCCRAKRSAG